MTRRANLRQIASHHLVPKVVRDLAEESLQPAGNAPEVPPVDHLLQLLARDDFLTAQQALEELGFAQDGHPVHDSAGQTLVAQVPYLAAQGFQLRVQAGRADPQRRLVHGPRFRFLASVGMQKSQKCAQVAVLPGLRQILHQLGAPDTFRFIKGLVGMELHGESPVDALGGRFGILRCPTCVASRDRLGPGPVGFGLGPREIVFGDVVFVVPRFQGSPVDVPGHPYSEALLQVGHEMCDEIIGIAPEGSSAWRGLPSPFHDPCQFLSDSDDLCDQRPDGRVELGLQRRKLGFQELKLRFQHVDLFQSLADARGWIIGLRVPRLARSPDKMSGRCHFASNIPTTKRAALWAAFSRNTGKSKWLPSPAAGTSERLRTIKKGTPNRLQTWANAAPSISTQATRSSPKRSRIWRTWSGRYTKESPVPTAPRWTAGMSGHLAATLAKRSRMAASGRYTDGSPSICPNANPSGVTSTSMAMTSLGTTRSRIRCPSRIPPAEPMFTTSSMGMCPKSSARFMAVLTLPTPDFMRTRFCPWNSVVSSSSPWKELRTTGGRSCTSASSSSCMGARIAMVFMVIGEKYVRGGLGGGSAGAEGCQIPPNRLLCHHEFLAPIDWQQHCCKTNFRMPISGLGRVRCDGLQQLRRSRRNGLHRLLQAGCDHCRSGLHLLDIFRCFGRDRRGSQPNGLQLPRPRVRPLCAQGHPQAGSAHTLHRHLPCPGLGGDRLSPNRHPRQSPRFHRQPASDPVRLDFPKGCRAASLDAPWRPGVLRRPALFGKSALRGVSQKLSQRTGHLGHRQPDPFDASRFDASRFEALGRKAFGRLGLELDSRPSEERLPQVVGHRSLGARAVRYPLSV